MLEDTLTQQHQELLAVAGELAQLLDRTKLEHDAAPALALLGKLAGILTAHLKLEDEQLYPPLLTSNDASIKEKAQQYVEEMGGIGKTFAEYVERWKTSDAIAGNASDFVVQTGQIFQVLSARIENEEGGLFPLLRA